MKNLALLIIFILFSINTWSQTPKENKAVDTYIKTATSALKNNDVEKWVSLVQKDKTIKIINKELFDDSDTINYPEYYNEAKAQSIFYRLLSDHILSFMKLKGNGNFFDAFNSYDIQDTINWDNLTYINIDLIKNESEVEKSKEKAGLNFYDGYVEWIDNTKQIPFISEVFIVFNQSSEIVYTNFQNIFTLEKGQTFEDYVREKREEEIIVEGAEATAIAVPEIENATFDTTYYSGVVNNKDCIIKLVAVNSNGGIDYIDMFSVKYDEKENEYKPMYLDDQIIIFEKFLDGGKLILSKINNNLKGTWIINDGTASQELMFKKK